MRHALRVSWLILIVLLIGMSLAHAVLPPEVYQEARAEAPFHIQVAVEDVTVPDTTPGDCTVSGKILRIFRDTPGTLADDQQITFPIACNRSDSEVFPGPVLWTATQELTDARYIEVYLVEGEHGLATAKWQSRIIEEPSSQPQLPVE